jgi:membrane fusion protein, multidrug efflux system
MKKTAKTKLILLLALILSLVVMSSCGESEAQNHTPEQDENRVAIKKVNVVLKDVVAESFSSYLTLVGEIQANNDALLAGQVSATLVDIPHDKGSYVNVGDTILVLDSRRFEAIAQMTYAQYENAKIDFEIAEKQFQQGLGVSETQFKKVRNALSAAEGQYKSVKVDLDNCFILAPFQGVVAERHINLGELVNPGAPLVRVVDNRSLKVKSGIPENQVLPMRKGSKATIRLSNLNIERESEISWVGATLLPRDRTLPIELKIVGDDVMKPGMVCDIIINKQSSENSIVIPLSVLQTAEDHSYVFVCVGEKAEYRTVKTGERSGNLIEILEGLASGDALITDGYRDLIDGQEVNVVGRVNQ